MEVIEAGRTIVDPIDVDSMSYENGLITVQLVDAYACCLENASNGTLMLLPTNWHQNAFKLTQRKLVNLTSMLRGDLKVVVPVCSTLYNKAAWSLVVINMKKKQASLSIFNDQRTRTTTDAVLKQVLRALHLNNEWQLKIEPCEKGAIHLCMAMRSLVSGKGPISEHDLRIEMQTALAESS